MMYFLYFLLWTFVIYWSHRLGHILPYYKDLHAIHHIEIDRDPNKKFHWSNLFLFFDSWENTIEQWVIEVIPTIVFSYVTEQYWLFVFYYLWTAFLQENIEHNKKFDLYPFLISGKWHMIHHQDSSKNFGVFFPIWDIIFGTSKC